MDKREKKIIVLGAGLVGNLIAIDLSEKFQVTAVDINEKILLKLKTDFNISTVKADLSNPDTIKEMIRDYLTVYGQLFQVMEEMSLLHLTIKVLLLDFL